jgi:hypothetical protein
VKLIETQRKSTLANWADDYSESSVLLGAKTIWTTRFPKRIESRLGVVTGKDKAVGSEKKIPQRHAAAGEAENNPVT